MTSLLDLLKAKGIDPTKLSSSMDKDKSDSSSDLKDDNTENNELDKKLTPSILADLLKPASPPPPMSIDPSILAPQAKNSLSATPSPDTGPTGMHMYAAPIPPVDTVTTPPIFDPQTHKQLLAEGTSGPNVAPASVSSPDISDDENESVSSKNKTRNPVSDHTNNPQASALQAAINSGGFTDNTVSGLKATQDVANDQKSKDNFFKGLSQITNGALQANFKAKDIDGSNTVKALDGLDKQADEGVQEFKDRGEQEKNDPKSALSVSARAFAAPMLAKMGMTLPDNVSYAGMEKLSPQLTKLYDTKTSQEAHNQDLQLKYSMLDQMKKQGSAANDDKFEQKLSMAEKDDLDPNKARAGNFAKAGAVKQSAERLEGLFQQFPDYNIPKGQTVELASAVAAMINGGSAQSQHQIDSITPDTLKGRGADAVANWITGDPMGRQQQAYMQMLHETEKREKGISEDQILRTQLQRLSAHGVIQRRFPDAHQQVLNGYGITPEMISAYNKTGKVPSSTPSVKPGVGSDSSPNVSTPEDQQAIDWANANPDDPRSKQILQIHGK